MTIRELLDGTEKLDLVQPEVTEGRKANRGENWLFTRRRMAGTVFSSDSKKRLSG